MSKTRLEAFSDGVIAILITIMVIEFRPPEEADWHALQTMTPLFLHYVLSFVYLAIYWNNHHHMLHATHRVTGGVLWANLHLLFWLSLVPFATAWLGEHHLEPLPTAVYGVVLLGAALAYTILQNRIIAAEGSESMLRSAVGRDMKGKLSLLFYVLAISFAFVNQWISDALYIAVALIWLSPDPRIERRIQTERA